MAETRTLLSLTHVDHAQKWSVTTGGQVPNLCIACAAELLEDSEVLLVRKRAVVAALLSALTQHSDAIMTLLTEDIRVAEHLLNLLLDDLFTVDQTLGTIIQEVIIQLLCKLKSDRLVLEAVNSITMKVEKQCNYLRSVPAFTLLSSLIQEIPPLAHTLIMAHKPFLEFICSGLTYPDDSVRITIIYLFVHMYASRGQHSTPSSEDDVADRIVIPSNVNVQVAECLLQLLKTSEHMDLQLNLLGLVKRWFMDEDLTSVLMRTSADGSTFPTAVKKCLLSKCDTVQVSAVQCLMSLITSQHETSTAAMYTESLLDADITEFLFEALATTNELLLESIFCCLMVFTDTQTFFTKCHVIYGIESVLRAVDLSFQQRKPSTIVRGMDLLGLILQKQPERMPLLSSDKTFTECLRIINTGISHSYHQVALSSGVAYCHLLRRQHIPSPVPYNALLNTLEQLVMRLHTLPTMRCIPSDNRKGQHNQSGLFRQAQSTQQMIECTLNCLRAVARLMLSCMDDPTANPETFAAPTSVSVSDMPVSSSIQFDVNIPGAMQASVSTHLLQLCDEHCMPAVIQNKQHLASSEIYRSLLDTLNIMFRIQPKMMKLFSEKLASVGFYRMALELKDQWPKNASLQDAVDQLVSVCCSTLMTAHHDGIQNSPTPVNFTDLKLGVQQLSGPLGKFILVLTQCSTVDRKLQAAQVACIALCHLFLEHDHSRMAACAPSLFRVLVTFLSLHADLSWIPPTSLQQLLSLCATAETALSPQQREELPAADRRLSRQNLLRALESVPDMHAIYGQNDVLLHWTFSDRVLAQTIGQRMLSDWLSQKSNHGGKHIELAVKMLLNNELFCNSFLGFLQSGTADTVLSLLDVLKVFIRQEDMLAAPDREELFDAVRARMPDLLQITDSSASISGAIHAILSFGCQLKAVGKKEATFDTYDLKLIQRVLQLLLKGSDVSAEVVQAALSYLYVSLLNTASMGDNRVISIMLSNEAFLQRLAASLTVIDEHETLPDQLSSHGDVPAIAGLLVAALAKFQHQSGIKSSVVVLATIEWLMDGMCSDRPLHQVSCLHLWTAWFHGAANSLSPVLDVHRKKKLSFLKDEDGQLDINSRDLRLLTFLLLNIIAKDVGLVQQCATDCIRVLLIYTEERSPTVAHHLIVQPWNQLLLLNISESHASMPAAGAVFSVLLTLVERNVESITIDKLILWSIQWLNSTHVERLLQLKESSTCIDLIEKVLTSKQRRPKLDSQVQKSLISTLEELQNHLQRDKLDVNCRCPREIMFHGSVPLCTNLFSKCCKIRLSKVQHLLGILT